MKKIDWVRKLTSRKFWVTVATFVSSLIIACGGGGETAETVSGLIIMGATAIAYIIGEGLIDAASVGSGTEDPTEDITVNRKTDEKDEPTEWEGAEGE